MIIHFKSDEIDKLHFRKFSISLMKLEGLQMVNGEPYKLMVHGLAWSMNCSIKGLILVMN